MVGDRDGETLMRTSAIDIGTNTILMLIADVNASGEFHVIRDEHVIARLGKGVDSKRMILPETFERVLGYLKDYKRIHEEVRSEKMVACGTSALRDAANSREFIDYIKKHLGFEISILSGDEEADLTYLGGISEFLGSGTEQQYAVVDIGGGSTEFTSGRGASITSKISLDIGSVRLTERFLKTSPPGAAGLQDAQRYAVEHLRDLPKLTPHTHCIGVAGTLTTLAAIDLQLKAYDRRRVSGHILTLETIRGIFNRLKRKRLDEIRAIPQILPQRADIILAGILILLEIMKKIGADRITASDRGLRYGIILREAKAI
jgi:exopolyphosphatase/guanosine-5'-triphosphate,3'-diphosphate pyrophosphatase